MHGEHGLFIISARCQRRRQSNLKLGKFPTFFRFCCSYPVAMEGTTREALPLSVLIFFIFLQFLAKFLPNNRLEHPLPGLAPPIWGPGSATIVGHLTLQLSAVSIHMMSLRNICRRKISLGFVLCTVSAAHGAVERSLLSDKVAYPCDL